MYWCKLTFGVNEIRESEKY